MPFHDMFRRRAPDPPGRSGSRCLNSTSSISFPDNKATGEHTADLVGQPSRERPFGTVSVRGVPAERDSRSVVDRLQSVARQSPTGPGGYGVVALNVPNMGIPRPVRASATRVSSPHDALDGDSRVPAHTTWYRCFPAASDILGGCTYRITCQNSSLQTPRR
jgi:hypothetical protein